jgi:alkaline phosphatase D
MDRRGALQSLLGAGMLSAGGLWLPAAARAQSPLVAVPRFDADPFSLGVASGYPTPDGVVLWTRLATAPAEPGGGMKPERIAVRWTVAADERFARVVASGTAIADPAEAHSLHVEVPGLEPGRHYWYRFAAGNAESPVGRTRTAPPAGPLEKLRFAFASCQQYEHGYYGAWAQVVRDDPDVVVFLGDYIYEASWGRNLVRHHGTPETMTLDDYRARYALYKSDPDLQAAHAALPWLLTWDDHEVQNDYGNDHPQDGSDPIRFLVRRAAAYRAFYEHQPLPASMRPRGPDMRIHARAIYGDLATFHLLDDRQYRSPHACPRPGRGGSNVVDPAACAELADPARTMLGAEQRDWLQTGLVASRTRWNILAQQTLMAQLDQKPGPGRTAWTDGWDGYPGERRRLLEFIAERRVANPVVIGGDVHMFYVADLKPDFDSEPSPVVASEFVTTSITSQGPSLASRERLRADNPHIRLAEPRYRGYTLAHVAPQRMTVDLRAMENVTSRDARCRTLASYTVESGRPGAEVS